MIEVDQDQREGEIANISIGGAFIQCKKPLALNETFSITINIPDRQPIPAKVQVVWSNVNIPEDKVLRRGMGIRFLEIADDDRRYIQIQSQPPPTATWVKQNWEQQPQFQQTPAHLYFPTEIRWFCHSWNNGSMGELVLEKVG